MVSYMAVSRRPQLRSSHGPLLTAWQVDSIRASDAGKGEITICFMTYPWRWEGITHECDYREVETTGDQLGS